MTRGFGAEVFIASLAFTLTLTVLLSNYFSFTKIITYNEIVLGDPTLPYMQSLAYYTVRGSCGESVLYYDLLISAVEGGTGPCGVSANTIVKTIVNDNSVNQFGSACYEYSFGDERFVVGGGTSCAEVLGNVSSKTSENYWVPLAKPQWIGGSALTAVRR